MTRHEVERRIAQTADTVWERMRGARAALGRPRTNREVAMAQAEEKAQEIREDIQGHQRHARAQRPPRMPPA